MESFLDTATSFVTSWSSWTLSVVVAFGDWLQSLNPAIGAAIGAVSMFAFVWIAVQSFTWLKFMVSMERLPGPLALPWLGNTWQLLGLLDPPRAWYVAQGGGTVGCAEGARVASTRLHKKDKKSHLAAKRYRENLVFVKWARRFLPLFRVWVGPVPAVVITDPSVARQILGPTGPHQVQHLQTHPPVAQNWVTDVNRPKVEGATPLVRGDAWAATWLPLMSLQQDHAEFSLRGTHRVL